MATIEIDEDSGFCFGVVTAIQKAEAELDKSGHLYCLGDIVHNSDEVERLKNKGLVTITHDDLRKLHNVKVLLRAHGEPPETYAIARDNGIEIIDATCPVVLKLQRRIHARYIDSEHPNTQIVIYGKLGHAEVNGLVGQTNGEAVVVENIDGLDRIDYSRDIALYSQTTKSLQGFKEIEKEISHRKGGQGFESFDTICRSVANRIPKIKEFARRHDAVIFVCGKKSSNGKILFAECREANANTFMVTNESEIDVEQLIGKESIGICGATSTPRWLMNRIKEAIESKL
ncbi:MAG: 4-hydroxy-3-methylbut-2-enyl diphosphate reductase [Muribaculaceae bacterium]|nr:4-hydroxy-3-methylbut-2-enyl diphosphate reductase [Muribaculaceae bacterium]MDY3932583.1 4-hydroxy-3-methylbut-2-enyl diphosphate reductase [Muribaculaceae bacterium]